MAFLAALSDLMDKNGVLTGADALPYGADWTGKFATTPLAVARPRNTAEVSAIVKLAAAHKVAIVPLSGRSGLVGGGAAEGALVLSLDRMNAIREIRTTARLAVVEAGVIMSNLHKAAHAQDLSFPMTFGAKDSAMIGGMLSTNAGGSNVLRYGNTRALVMGVEVVMPDGEILDVMSELHKDNSGYDLKDLFIGAEGTLGIITAAVVKLVARPKAFATAFVALPDLSDALTLLNAVQARTGNAVEAFEFMTAGYIDLYRKLFPDAQMPFADTHPVQILIEVGATSETDALADEDGSLPIVNTLQDVMAEMLEDDRLADAVVAQTDEQRIALWKIRESAAELAFHRRPFVDSDISVPLDQVVEFITRFNARIKDLDAGAEDLIVSHLGDGNIHHTLWPSRDDPQLMDDIRTLVEDIVADLRGSFSAEHGIGLNKRNTMARRKDPTALNVMRKIKTALDPENIMNPGKVLPPEV